MMNAMADMESKRRNVQNVLYGLLSLLGMAMEGWEQRLELYAGSQPALLCPAGNVSSMSHGRDAGPWGC